MRFGGVSASHLLTITLAGIACALSLTFNVPVVLVAGLLGSCLLAGSSSSAGCDPQIAQLRADVLRRHSGEQDVT
jgi:hypothetical protein